MGNSLRTNKAIVRFDLVRSFRPIRGVLRASACSPLPPTMAGVLQSSTLGSASSLLTSHSFQISRLPPPPSPATPTPRPCSDVMYHIPSSALIMMLRNAFGRSIVMWGRCFTRDWEVLLLGDSAPSSPENGKRSSWGARHLLPGDLACLGRVVPRAHRAG
jgi:hypothetical protein